MSANGETGAAWSYHDATKHSWASVRTGAHMMDFTNQPRPWKLYEAELPAIDLGGEPAASGANALDALRGPSETGARSFASLRMTGLGGPRVSSATVSFSPEPERGAEAHSQIAAGLTLPRIAALLLLSAGVTKQLSLPGGTMRFRAAACTGALYHIELYLVTADLPGLPAGVYHYGAHDNRLRLLWAGDFRDAVARATSGEPAVSGAQAVIAYTTTYWRNAWKYGARAYRHAFWDSGTIIANTLATASAHGIAASVVTGFVDDDVNRLLGVDGETEAAVALVPLGRAAAPPPDAPSVEPLALGTVPLSREEIDFPAIRAMHAASSLGPDDDVAAWRRNGAPQAEAGAGEVVALPETSGSGRGLEDTIARRGSSRRFERAPVTLTDAAAVLGAAGHRVPLDATAPEAPALTEAYVIANGIDGVPPGAYRYLRGEGRDRPALERLHAGEVREAAAHLDLDQPLGGDAAFNVYFLADLHTLLGQLGNRAYRAAHLDASIAAGRLYLAAYAMGLGATDLTFYDDEVTEFFGPSAADKSVMFLIAVGVPAGRRSP